MDNLEYQNKIMQQRLDENLNQDAKKTSSILKKIGYELAKNEHSKIMAAEKEQLLILEEKEFYSHWYNKGIEFKPKDYNEN